MSLRPLVLLILYILYYALVGVAKLVGTLSYNLKGCEFDPQTGHIPGLGV